MDEEIKLITEPITRAQLRAVAIECYGDMVKAVVDIQKKTMAIGGEMHADEESCMLEQGSKQVDLWGINLYPDKATEGFVEFDSMINLRPRQGNRSRGVDSLDIQKKIKEVVRDLIKDV